jgi:hypothetical protein
MPSVKTRFNPQPPAPRLRITDCAYLTTLSDRLKNVAEKHVNAKGVLKVHLVGILRIHGQQVGGNNDILRERCVSAFCAFATTLFNPLHPNQILTYKHSVVGGRPTDVFTVLEDGLGTSILNADVLPYLDGADMPPVIMTALVQMLLAREFDCVNSCYLKSSVHLPRTIMLLPNMDWMVAKTMASRFNVSGDKPVFSNISGICKPVFRNERWYLFLIDVAVKGGSIHIFNPHHADEDEFDASLKTSIR